MFAQWLNRQTQPVYFPPLTRHGILKAHRKGQKSAVFSESTPEGGEKYVPNRSTGSQTCGHDVFRTGIGPG